LAGILFVGVFVEFVMSTSVCIWNPHQRCFSIPRDTIGLLGSAARQWIVLALAMGLLVATVAQANRGLRSGVGIILAPISLIGVSILPIALSSLAREAMFDPIVFLAVWLVLFAGYQFSLFIGKLAGRLQR
jgi:hypothetical protein